MQKLLDTTGFHPWVYNTKDFNNKTTSIQFTVKLYDEDGLNDSQKKEVEDAISSASSVLAIAFPVFAPYAALAAGTGTALMNLVSNFDSHDRILDETVMLHVNKTDKGHQHFQPGFYVCFDIDIEDDSAANMYVHPSGKIYYKDADKYKEFPWRSYAVFRVEKDYESGMDLQKTQELEKLLVEIENGKQSRTVTELNFAKDVTNSYFNFERLKRWHDLKDKTNPTQAEQDLLAEIAKDPEVKPYLPR